ncbi:MAG: glycosyltransferase family 2 protein [Dehalococcoidia bacterium]|nr:glycosyltransferase family 2 protein [Dehalococcoidia bacterium]MSQ34698.1 glycosyltransferase family 2 protein [Dehalococcoidia bacterium]
MSKLFLSIVVPAYNEEARIGAGLERLTAYLNTRPWSWELLIVDDGSGDRTVEIVRNFAALEPRVKLINAPHGGKGAAVKRGLSEAQGEWRFMCDADLSMPPEHIDRFFAGEGGRPRFDVSIGSREAPGANRIGEPLKRHIYGRLFNYLVQAVALRGIRDTQCGFKLLSAEAVETIFPRQRLLGLGFDVEVLFLARKAGFTIGEIAIDWRYEGQSKVTLSKGALGFFDVVRVRLNHLGGRYRGIRRAK